MSLPKSVFTDRYSAFCRLLLETRHARRLTQVAVATRLRKPQSFVSKYERGERRLDVVEFIEVAHALGLAPTELLRRLEKMIK